jgi:hypothetical protein
MIGSAWTWRTLMRTFKHNIHSRKPNIKDTQAIESKQNTLMTGQTINQMRLQSDRAMSSTQTLDFSSSVSF